MPVSKTNIESIELLEFGFHFHFCIKYSYLVVLFTSKMKFIIASSTSMLTL